MKIFCIYLHICVDRAVLVVYYSHTLNVNAKEERQMSKIKFSEEQTIRIGIVEKVECDGVAHWKLTNMAPSWTYKYLLQHGMNKDHMTYNPFATEECADWLRVYYPDKAVFMNLADTMKCKRNVGSKVGTHELGYTGVQYPGANDEHWIRISSPRCPSALVEYVMTHCPEEVDDLYGRVKSEVFMTDKFADWVCDRDKRLADLLGVGWLEAVRFADPIERAWP